MGQINAIDVSEYSIVWNQEEAKNVVVFAIRVFTAKQMWVFVLCRCFTVSVHHRFSTLYKFHTAVQSLLPRDAPPFPPKRFGTRSNYDPAYLRVRCIALTQYFQAVLRCERVRHTKDFYALFLPSEGVEARPAGIEEEEEEEEVLTTGRVGCVV